MAKALVNGITVAYDNVGSGDNVLVGHMPNLERATEFNAALGRLLRHCADGKAT
jgi:hypothetical protein